MFSKAHLTSHFRMSGSRWVITSSWLSGSWRSFLYSCSVCFCHLFSISLLLNISIPFLFFIVLIFAWNVPLVCLVFLKRSLVLPILLFSSISLDCLLRKPFLSLLAILWSSAFKNYWHPLDHRKSKRGTEKQLPLLIMPKPLTVWITTNCGKVLKRWEYQTSWPASWEICMLVRKEQLELDMEQLTDSKSGKKYIKVVYCHSASLTYMQRTSCEMPG